MKIKFCLGLKFYITLALAALLVVLSVVGIIPVYYTVIATIALVFTATSLFEIRFSSPVVFAVFTALAGLLGGAFSVYFGQFMMECDISRFTPVTLFSNLVLCSLLYFILLTAFGRIKPAVTLGALAFFILHLANYALYLFRGREFSLSDLYSIKIAVTVAGNYTLTLSNKAILSILALLYVLYFTLITLRTDKSKRTRMAVRFTALGAAALCSVGVWWSVANSPNSIQNWGKNGTFVNGVAYNLIVELRESRVVAPEGYSPERVESILSRYEQGETEGEKPHIIVIMDEAFSDLSVLGEFETNIEVMPFFSSLTENTTKGNALSSVLGGNTATSEWEFLTGNTAAFLPAGSVAYQQYVHDHAWSIVTTLKDEGYTAIAMHPYNKSGWKRDLVYPIMKFDKMRFIDDLTTTDKVRGLVSDRSFFSDIISEFESRKDGEKLFMFNITMQNHGGYTWGSSFKHTVDLVDKDYYEAEQYLTLINMTDTALRELVEYFEGVSEPVMLVFFGDHQPSFSQDFYTDIMPAEVSSFDKTQKKQTVPFLIWTNYDTEEETGLFTGLNSLSSLVLEKAGIALPPYIAFLSDMRKTIPAMNAYGYYSPSLSRNARTSEATGEEARFLEEYRILQYNNLFDRKNRASAFE